MENGTSILGLDISIWILLLLAIIALLAFVTASLAIKLRRLTKRYRVFLKGKNVNSLEKIFEDQLYGATKGISLSESNRDDIRSIKRKLGHTLTHYGIVKYDAFDDVGGKMSFALAMLDDSNTGFILNTIHSRDNCFQYIKEIVRGKSYIILSTEEREALNHAIENKETEEIENKKLK